MLRKLSVTAFTEEAYIQIYLILYELYKCEYKAIYHSI